MESPLDERQFAEQAPDIRSNVGPLEDQPLPIFN